MPLARRWAQLGAAIRCKADDRGAVSSPSKGSPAFFFLGRAIAWLSILAIGVLSLLPAEDIVRTNLGGHSEHVLAYATTTLFVSASYRAGSWFRVPSALSAYAALLEFLQQFSPGRTAGIDGVFFSLMGIALGVCAFRIGRGVLVWWQGPPRRAS